MAAAQLAGPTGSLFVDDGGSGGIPVVFVHAFAGSTAHWAAQLNHLRLSRRAVALDLRGHGQSAPPFPPDYDVQSLAQDIGAATDGLGIERFVLVGHSLGGQVAIAYAGSQPERVSGLLLVGVPGRIPGQQAEQILASLQSNYDNVIKSFWDRLLIGAKPHVRNLISREMGGMPRDVALTLIKATLEFDPLPLLSAYNGPKLAVVTHYGYTPNDLHKLIQDLPHKVVAGTSHWVQMDKPGIFNRILDGFLTSIDRGTIAHPYAEGIRTLLERFGQALNAADVMDASRCWETPALLLSDEGASVFSRMESITEMFNKAVEWYRSRELTMTRPEIERIEKLSDTLVEVDVKWPALDKTGKKRATERSHYILHFQHGKPRIQVALIRTTPLKVA